MPVWICENCGSEFNRNRSGARPIRFCSQDCYRAVAKTIPNGGRFSKGITPWNKELKGIHLSPETQFKPGRQALNKMPLGTVRIRHRKKEPFPRAFVKIAEPNVWRERAKIVWEEANGSIPRGSVIHHIDRDPLNDSLENLECLTRAEHIAEHREESREARREGLRKAWGKRRGMDQIL